MDYDQYIRIQQLMATRQTGVTAISEDTELEAWLATDPANQQLYDQLVDPEKLGLLYADYLSVREAMQSQLNAALPELLDASPLNPSPVHRIHFLKTAWFRYAAILLLITGVGTYLWIQQKEKPETVIINPAPLKNDVLPGKEGAILTLADGTQMILDSLGNGIVASQNGAQVVLKNGLLTYDPTREFIEKTVYNTITTPKGRQFRVMLPDGTKVWLNAASSLRYPTAFTGKERKVEVTGEAYFEVAKNARLPFRVNVNNKADIEVLGTHFNVNAYETEESLNTTLLQGSVKINGTTLKPGQQAQLADAIRVVNHADIDNVMAWKNGLFNFEGAGLRQVMRQLERWYDINVRYEGPEPNIEFQGKMYSDVPLSEVLKVLQKAGVKLRTEGRTVVIE